MDESVVRDLFLELVRLDSPSLREGRVAQRCKRELESLGFRVEEDDAGRRLGGEAGNLIATLEGDPACPPVLLLAHLDTVELACGVRPRVDEEGTVRSDGTTALGADDKAGVAAVLAAARALAAGGKRHGTVQVVLTVAEELGCRGARLLPPGRIQAQFGLALDAPGPVGTLVVAGFHQARWEAEVLPPVTGPGSHGRTPSAVRLAARAVAELPRPRPGDGVKVNVATFSGDAGEAGGGAVRLTGEVRGRDPTRLEPFLSRIRDAFQRSAAECGGRVEFAWEKTYDGFQFSPGDPVRLRAERAIARAGLSPRAVEEEHGSDANVLCSLGIPTINAGVGYHAHHSRGEHVRLQDIARAARVALEFCLSPEETG